MRRAVIVLILGTAVLSMGCASGKAAKEEKSAEPAPSQPAGPVTVAEPRPEVAATPDEVPELPAYPGARRTKLETSSVPTLDWARKIKVELAARDTFENVKAFYVKVIKDNGWEVAGASEEEGKVGWRLVKDGAVAEVRIEREGRKRVEIKLERKDR